MRVRCGWPITRPDAGADRDVSAATTMPCAASGAKAKAKVKPTHDHAQFHKNQ
jgi:hypothetical protein